MTDTGYTVVERPANDIECKMREAVAAALAALDVEPRPNRHDWDAFSARMLGLSFNQRAIAHERMRVEKTPKGVRNLRDKGRHQAQRKARNTGRR